LFTTIWVDQFTRLRDGDRFWYLNDPALSPSQRVEVSRTTLADIIRRNTGVTSLAANVFFVPE
jgi:peroxidase